MQALANFLGELGGESWTTQSVALILAALLALSAAVITARVTINQGVANRKAAASQTAESAQKDRDLAKDIGDRERELKAREHWWLRFKAVSDDLTSGDQQRKAVALVLMEKLAESHWADRNDKLMIVSVLAELRRSTTKQGTSK
jgi:hypothetical protein